MSLKASVELSDNAYNWKIWTVTVVWTSFFHQIDSSFNTVEDDHLAIKQGHNISCKTCSGHAQLPTVADLNSQSIPYWLDHSENLSSGLSERIYCWDIDVVIRWKYQEPSRIFFLIYKTCSPLHLLIGLQRNTLYSKTNQSATAFLRHIS